MRIVLFTNLLPAVTAVEQLRQHGWLKAVVTTDKLQAHPRQLQEIHEASGTTFLQVNKTNMLKTITLLFAEVKPDVVIMLGFSYRIPPVIFNMPPLGFYNVHFSLLPAYRGPDPIFHQLKNGEQTGGISIHKVDHGFDTGDIVRQQPVPFIAGENWGLCHKRYFCMLPNMLMAFIEDIKAGVALATIESGTGNGSYCRRPDEAALTINWQTQTATEIENLVNASNPAYGGAITFFNTLRLRILEVSPVDGASFPDAAGGEIVHHDHTGLFIQCADQNILRINVAMLEETIFSGFKLGLLGIHKGTRLGGVSPEYQTTY